MDPQPHPHLPAQSHPHPQPHPQPHPHPQPLSSPAIPEAILQDGFVPKPLRPPKPGAK